MTRNNAVSTSTLSSQNIQVVPCLYESTKGNEYMVLHVLTVLITAVRVKI